jgi:hypothetical protein
MRLGQLMWALAGCDPFFIEEDKLVEAANELKRLRASWQAEAPKTLAEAEADKAIPFDEIGG